MPYVNPIPNGVYLDNNATMPLLPSVREALVHALESPFDLANPSSIHKPGQRAKERLYQAKKALSEYLGTQDAEQWIFISGATEGINTILKSFEGSAAVAYSNVDHSAVFESVAKMKWQQSFELKVKSSGQFCENSLSEFEAALEAYFDTSDQEDKKCLLNWQLVNNETGLMFRLEILETLIKKFNTPKKQRLFVLVDAAQALGKVDESYIRKAMHLADYMVFSAHKIGGPMGIGALWMREGIPFSPLVQGGSQEKRRRAGTHNTLGIAGFLAAIQDWKKNGETYRTHMHELKKRALMQLSRIEGFSLHGDQKAQSLSNTFNFHFAGCRDESLLLALDLEGFYLSSGSACNSGSLKPSRVLLNMGISEEDALSSLRFCIGPQNTEEEIDLFCERLEHRVKHIRESRSKWDSVLPEMKPDAKDVTP
ncbi:MAG: cysteine desulfurase family protein [Bdellovibrionota bacterium]